MKQEFKTVEELQARAAELEKEKKWAVQGRQTGENSFEIQYIEHKDYTAHDGKVFPDEIWQTEAGEMVCIQDLEPEHAKNVLRMLLRQEREKRYLMYQIMGALASQGVLSGEDNDEGIEMGAPAGHTIH